jgi:RNA polymerase sigma-70 factor (ECF subfamily)
MTASIEFLKASIDSGSVDSDRQADLELAQACCLGDREAVERLERELVPKLRATVARVDRSAEFIDEVLQLLRIRLLVGEGGQQPRICSYDGRGTLLGWMRVVAARIALGLKRGDARRPSVDDLDEAAEQLDLGDPELDHLRANYKEVFRAALRSSFKDLERRERTVLRLRFIDGLRISEICSIYRVHRATVTRWIQRAREKVRLGTRAHIMSHLELTEAQAESLLRFLDDDFQLSVSILVADAADP